jgi:hypothetical protein
VHRHPWLAIVVLVATTVSTGCHWNRWFRRPGSEPSPVLFTALPVKAEAVAALNANTQRIRTLQAQGATVSVPGLPAISADLALERPLRLRFRAGTTWTGQELDLGSNDELFWFWAARDPVPQVMYARHDRFALSHTRNMLPVEPTWLVEALGLVELEPSTVSEPVAAGKDRIEIRSRVATPQGEMTRLIHLHAQHGYILEQHLLDARGQIKATSRLSQHEFYPLDGVSLARKIEVQVPQAQMQFQLDVTTYTINQPFADGQALFELPREQLKDYKFVDIADPSFVPVGVPNQPTTVSPPSNTAPVPAVQAEARYRGFTTQRY